MVKHVIRNAVDYALRNLCSCRAVKIDGLPSVDASSKGWKLRANGFKLMCDVGHRRDVKLAFQALETKCAAAWLSRELLILQ